MFRVITRNSVYQVCPVDGGFYVKRMASTFGQVVKANHLHFTPSLDLGIGRPMVTTVLSTTNVVGIIAA